MITKIIILAAFFAVMIGVGIYARRKVKNLNDFVLGGRSIGPWLTAFSYGTAYFSAVIFVGYAGQFGWKYGVSASWIGLGNAFIGGLLAWVVLGRRTRVMTNHLKSSTMPDFFEKRYGSKGLKLAASAIIFIFLIPYTASLYNGLSRIFGVAFNIDYSYCIIAMAVLTGVYVILGGYVATSMNDFIQGLIMLVGIVAVIASVLAGQGGFSEALTALSKIEDAKVSAQSGVFTSFFGPDPWGLLLVVLLTSLGTWGLPQMVHKFYAIKDERSVRSGTVISTVFALIIAGGCYFLGGFGRLFDSAALYDSKGAVIFDRIIPAMISTLPDLLVGIVVILVLSASMSTLAALVMASSSTMTIDFIKGTVAKQMKEKTQMLVMRSLLVFFILISAVVALIQYKSTVTFIAQLMGISWGALAGSFIAPFLYGLYSKRVSAAGVWASFITGIAITVSNMFIGYLASPIYAGVLAMAVGLVVTPVVSLIAGKPDGKRVAEIFSCYDRPSLVTAKQAIGKEANGK